MYTYASTLKDRPEIDKCRTALQVSIAALWIFTGVTSIWFAYDTGLELMHKAGLAGGNVYLLVFAGATIDIVLGLAMLINYRIKLICSCQIVIMIGYMLLISILIPDYWLHPFGAITKNIPLVMCTIFIMQSSQDF